jgi:hypothetical protein
MGVFSIGIELPSVAAVQRPHDAYPSEHRGAVLPDHQHKRLDRGLPFGKLSFFLRQEERRPLYR